MSELSQNITAVRNAVIDLNVQSRQGRNAVVRDYYNKLTPGVQESLTFSHGTQVYQKKTLDQFFKLIKNRSIKTPIKFNGGDDNALLARAANEMYSMVYARSMTVMDTGKHLNSLNMYIREVGGKALLNITSGGISEGQLPDRAIVSIVPTVAYASTLESRGVIGGLLYFAAKQLRSKYGSTLAVKYDYISGKNIGEGGGGTFPRVQIGHFGNLKPGLKTPGRSTKKKRSRK
jgi:hypothetical protein